MNSKNRMKDGPDATGCLNCIVHRKANDDPMVQTIPSEGVEFVNTLEKFLK